MNAITLRPITSLTRAAAVLLTLGLFTIGSMPAAGHAFPGAMHWVAHIATYTLIAFTFCFGWQQRPALHIAALVAIIGTIHEATEIITHSHGFETEDAIVNALGALIGAATQRAITR